MNIQNQDNRVVYNIDHNYQCQLISYFSKIEILDYAQIISIFYMPIIVQHI
jgi:hypothetical protein